MNYLKISWYGLSGRYACYAGDVSKETGRRPIAIYDLISKRHLAKFELDGNEKLLDFLYPYLLVSGYFDCMDAPCPAEHPTGSLRFRVYDVSQPDYQPFVWEHYDMEETPNPVPALGYGYVIISHTWRRGRATTLYPLAMPWIHHGVNQPTPTFAGPPIVVRGEIVLPNDLKGVRHYNVKGRYHIRGEGSSEVVLFGPHADQLFGGGGKTPVPAGLFAVADNRKPVGKFLASAHAN
jgi:hypothetical protein